MHTLAAAAEGEPGWPEQLAAAERGVAGLACTAAAAARRHCCPAEAAVESFAEAQTYRAYGERGAAAAEQEVTPCTTSHVR